MTVRFTGDSDRRRDGEVTLPPPALDRHDKVFRSSWSRGFAPTPRVSAGRRGRPSSWVGWSTSSRLKVDTGKPLSADRELLRKSMTALIKNREDRVPAEARIEEWLAQKASG